MSTSTSAPSAQEQLPLITSELPLQFRLDQRTRQRGLAHIAAIRRQLAERHPQRRLDAGTVGPKAA